MDVAECAASVALAQARNSAKRSSSPTGCEQRQPGRAPVERRVVPAHGRDRSRAPRGRRAPVVGVEVGRRRSDQGDVEAHAPSGRRERAGASRGRRRAGARRRRGCSAGWSGARRGRGASWIVRSRRPLEQVVAKLWRKGVRVDAAGGGRAATQRSRIRAPSDRSGARRGVEEDRLASPQAVPRSSGQRARHARSASCAGAEGDMRSLPPLPTTRSTRSLRSRSSQSSETSSETRRPAA